MGPEALQMKGRKLAAASQEAGAPVPLGMVHPPNNEDPQNLWILVLPFGGTRVVWSMCVYVCKNIYKYV